MASQSKRMSLIETSTNLALGLLLSILVVQPIVFSYWHIVLAPTENITIAAVFTLVSLVRGYVVRRAFNWYNQKESNARNV